jgi:hypothetical protein
VGGTSYTKTFDDVTTLVAADTLPGLIDQRFLDHPIWRIIGAPENRIESRFAQDRVEIAVRAGRNKTLKFFQSATTEVDLFDTQYTTKGWYPPAILAGVVVYTDIEKEQVEGNRTALKSLVQEKMDILEDSVDATMSSVLWGDGSAGTTMGFGAFVPVSPGTFTVGALSEATYPMWQPYYESIGAWKTFGYFGSTTDKVIRAINMCADGTKRVNLLACDLETWALHHDSLGAKVSYYQQDQFGKIGSYTLQLMGIPLVADKDADAGTLIGLNTKYIKLVVSPGMNMRVSPTKTLEKSPLVSYNFWVFRHQLVFTRRNVHFRLDGIT